MLTAAHFIIEMQFDEAENRWAMDFDAMQELILRARACSTLQPS